jgi:hypothetical protein
MLMIALQEIGIEGPRMNLQGANVDYPVHINYGQPMVAPPLKREDPTEAEEVPIGEAGHSIPENTSISSGTTARHPSILRKGMNTAAARARGASTSRKHVDFSLGMANLSSNDVMGDVFEDRSVRIDDVVRTSNREAAERRMQDLAEEEEERRTSRSASASAASSNKGSRRPSNLTTTTTNEGRPSVDAHSVRSGASSARNRFFRHRSSVSRDGNDLESGRGVSPGAPVPGSSGAQEDDHHHLHLHQHQQAQVHDHDERHMQ